MGYGVKQNAVDERIERHISWARILRRCFCVGLRGSEEEKRVSERPGEDPAGQAAAPDC
jgi:hypothetical protein